MIKKPRLTNRNIGQVPEKYTNRPAEKMTISASINGAAVTVVGGFAVNELYLIDQRSLTDPLDENHSKNIKIFDEIFWSWHDSPEVAFTSYGISKAQLNPDGSEPPTTISAIVNGVTRVSGIDYSACPDPKSLDPRHKDYKDTIELIESTITEKFNL